GSRNRMLNQMTADATGVTVIAGPSEGSAIGKALIQARTAGMAGSLHEMRRIVSNSTETDMFIPCHTAEWDDAYNRFITLPEA
ncbi:MAG: rhamnulokinase, partial [Muribaculaceae bacterium]|nr:rhamnulokinase [Muribaculaceae bacterium]